MSTLKPDTFLQGSKYKIVRFISAGGFGCTYEGIHVLLKKRVAIKEFFVKDFCNRDETTSEVTVGITSKTALVNKLKTKFLDEAQYVSTLKHQHVVNVYDVFDENGTAYYVMDYIDGPSLNNIIKREGSIGEQKALKYILQVADALKYVHSQNRLHLDVKPGNIMIDENDNAVLIDFGASKQYDEEVGENTSTLMGKTPGYAPLEQMGNDVVKFLPSTDIYALGATLYKILTGITPPSATLLASGEELKPLPSSVSENVRNAVYKAMRTNKMKRPQTMDEFVKMLTAQVGDENTVMDDDVTVQTADQAERVRKEAEAKAAKEKAEAEARAKAEAERKAREEARRKAEAERIAREEAKRKEEEEKKKREQKKNVQKWILIAAVAVIAVLGCVYVANSNKSANNEEASGSSSVESASGSSSTSVNGHEAVDLGLSVKWATCNVGATTPEAYGDYFAWGETEPKGDYSWSTYFDSVNGSDSNFKKYATNKKTVLDPEDDAASVIWGGSWRLPTKAEQDELREKCTWKWKTMNGKNGYEVKSKTNGNSIFLPAAGYRRDTSLSGAGSYGYYWSSSLYTYYSDYAFDLLFDSSYVDWSYYYRYYGQSARPVCQ